MMLHSYLYFLVRMFDKRDFVCFKLSSNDLGIELDVGGTNNLETFAFANFVISAH